MTQAIKACTFEFTKLFFLFKQLCSLSCAIKKTVDLVKHESPEYYSVTGSLRVEIT